MVSSPRFMRSCCNPALDPTEHCGVAIDHGPFSYRSRFYSGSHLFLMAIFNGAARPCRSIPQP